MGFSVYLFGFGFVFFLYSSVLSMFSQALSVREKEERGKYSGRDTVLVFVGWLLWKKSFPGKPGSLIQVCSLTCKHGLSGREQEGEGMA